VAKWSYGVWSSDAQLFYFRMTDTRLDGVVLCNGAFAQFRGKDLISHDRPLQWLEWNRHGGREQVTCSEPNAGRTFAGSVLG
jgi:hypothetical protein